MIRRDLPAVIVLEAPPPGGCGPLGALDDAAGEQLARAVDLPRERLLAGLERVQLIDVPGAGASYESWPADPARMNAANMVHGTPFAFDGRPWRWPDLHGRVVLLAGRRVTRAFASVLGLPLVLPPLVRVAWRDAEWVVLPNPSERCRWWCDPDVRAATGEVVRAEVLRREAALRSWSTFGEDGRTGSGDGSCFGFRAADCDLRWLPALTDAGWDAGERLTAPGPLASLAIGALARNLRRVLRWGGGSTCTVLAHTVRVALLAAEASRLRGDIEEEQAACLLEGMVHDLPEALPGIGDWPTPAKRWLSLASPEVAALHVRATAAVRALVPGLRPASERVTELVAWADHAAMAVERAAYFNDAPEWLGPHRELAQKILGAGKLVGRIRSSDRANSSPEHAAFFGRYLGGLAPSTSILDPDPWSERVAKDTLALCNDREVAELCEHEGFGGAT